MIPLRHYFILTLALTLGGLLSGCSAEDLQWQSGKQENITGRIIGVTGALSSHSTNTKSCLPATVSLFSLTQNGDRSDKELAEVPIDDQGYFSFNADALGLALKGKSPNKAQSKPYVLFAKDCADTIYVRPLTGVNKQDLSHGSTLISYLLNTNKKGVFTTALENTPEDISSLLESLSESATYNAAFETLQNSEATKNKFIQIFNAAPDIIAEAAPEIVAINAPSTTAEGAHLKASVKLHHWRANFNPAYVWKFNGKTIGNSAVLEYTPSANSQGENKLEIIVGTNDGNGLLDSSKQTTTSTKSIQISNDLPPIAPDIEVASPIITGTTPTNSRNLVLEVDTGLDLSNCASFSELAITEDHSAPPSQAFNITCTESIKQSINWSLSSPGDGSKSIYIWAQDSAGTISAPKIVSINLDTTAPAVNFDSIPPAISNNPIQAISFNGTDSGGTIDYFECRIDNSAYEVCTSPKVYSELSDGPHSFFVRAADLAGNLAEKSATITIDQTPPLASIESAPPEFTNSLSAHFTFSASDHDSGSPLSYECSLDNDDYAPCLNPHIFFVNTGAHDLKVRALDIAGNTSPPQNFTWTVDIEEPSISITNPAAMRGNANVGQLQWTLTEKNVPATAHFSIELYNGTTWIDVTTLPATPGENLNEAYSATSLNIPQLDISNAKMRVTLTDAAGNKSVQESTEFRIDSTAPTISTFVVNNGIELTSGATIPVNILATDDGSGIKAYRLSTFSDFASAEWLESPPTNFPLPFSTGTYMIYAQAIDHAGNLSNVLEQTIVLTLGQPPTLSLIKPDGSDSYITNNQIVHTSWKITLTSANAIAPDGISAHYSLDFGTTLVDWPGGTGFGNTQNGSCVLDPGATGCVDLTLPPELANQKFIFILSARDVAGNKAIMASVMQNSPSGLSLFAGQDTTLLGGTALTTTLSKLNSMARDPVSGDLYVFSDCQILKIDAATSIISRFAGHPTICGDNGNSLQEISNARFRIAAYSKHAIVIDSKRNIYWASQYGIWKYDYVTKNAAIIVGARQEPYSSEDGTPASQFKFGFGISSLDLGKDDTLYFGNTYRYDGTGGTYNVIAVFRLESDGTVTKVAGVYDITTPTATVCAEGDDIKSCRLHSFSIVPGNSSRADRIFLRTQSENGFWEADQQGKMKRITTVGSTVLSRYLSKRNAIGVSGGYNDGLRLYDVDTGQLQDLIHGLDPAFSNMTYELADDNFGGFYLTAPPFTKIGYIDRSNNLSHFAGRSALGGDGGPATFAELRNPIQLSFNDTTGDLQILDSGVTQPIVRKVSTNGIITALQNLKTDSNTAVGKRLSTGGGPLIAWPYSYNGFFDVVENSFRCIWACGNNTNPSLPTLSTANSTQLYNACGNQGSGDNAAITMGQVAYDGNMKYIYLFDRKNFGVASTRSYIRKIDSNNNMTEVAGSASMPYPAGGAQVVTAGSPLISTFAGQGTYPLWVANGVFYILNSEKIFTGTEGGQWVQQAPETVHSFVVSRNSDKVYYLSGLKLYMKSYTADGSGSGILLADFTGAFKSLMVNEIRTSDHSVFLISGNSVYKYTHPSIE